MTGRPTNYSRRTTKLDAVFTLWLASACTNGNSGEPTEVIATGQQALSTSYSASFQQGTNGYSGTSDSYLLQNQPSTNFGSGSLLLVDGDEPSDSAKDASAIVRWDISAIPTGATVTSAAIAIQVTNSSANSYPIFSLNRAFEAASTSWNNASTGVSWAISGAMGAADRDATSLGTISASRTGSYTVTLNSSGLAELQSWVRDPASNFGLIIASSSNTDGLDFYSSEASTVAYRPKLTVAYTMDAGDSGSGGASSTGGGSATGGVSTTGGTLTHGSASPIGGNSSAGGVSSTGGASATGGISATGGTLAHGSASPIGGNSSAGGVSSTGSASATGGISATGGASATGGGTSAPFGFFVFSDSHVTSSNSLFSTAVPQMAAIDPAPLAGLSVGDFTNTATSTEWSRHTTIAKTLFDPTATSFGVTPRYLGAPGNHDISSANWFSYWTSNLPGQANLGHSGTDGIYFTTTYQNVFLAVMDSNKASGPSTSYSDPQTLSLGSELAASTAQFKFLFFHKPVYTCNSSHAGYAEALPWVDLAEKRGVDVIFSGHSHVYTRTCPMNRATCTPDGTGPVQIELGTVSGGLRSIDVSTAVVNGTDSAGVARSDVYNCTSNLRASRSASNSFCYVRVAGCQASVSCYLVGAGNTTPFDTFTLDHCG